MQYILFVLACLSNEPGQCVGQPLDLPEITNATACHLASRLRMEEWALDHPELKIKEAKCMARPIALTEATRAS